MCFVPQGFHVYAHPPLPCSTCEKGWGVILFGFVWMLGSGRANTKVRRYGRGTLSFTVPQGSTGPQGTLGKPVFDIDFWVIFLDFCGIFEIFCQLLKFFVEKTCFFSFSRQNHTESFRNFFKN